MYATVLNIAAMVVTLVAAPLVPGAAAAARARSAGLSGPSVIQPYWQIAKLLRKQYIAPTVASPIYWSGTLVGVAAVTSALVAVPAAGGISLPSSDAVVVAYLLMLATFLQVMAALDTGTPFGGMGASRETMFAALAEPGLMIAILGLTVGSGTTRLSSALAMPEVSPMGLLGHASIALALLVLGLAENSRMPFDNPATHLELTMVHEAMVLEQSGPGLALVHLQSALKLTLFWLLALNVVVPMARPDSWGPIVLVLIPLALVAGGTLLGLLESWLVKARLFRAPDLLVVGLAMAFFGLLVGVIA